MDLCGKPPARDGLTTNGSTGSDAAIYATTILIVVALYFLMPVVKGELDRYLSRLKSGEIKKFHKYRFVP